MVTHRGIEVNLDQIKAINNLQPPRNPKEVQKLTGMMAALNQFISRSANKCRPFFFLLYKWKEFEWSEECVMAFQELKQYLSHPPIMSSLVVDEVLFAYIAVALYAISFVLIRVDSGIQRPVYYVSKSLNEAEMRYLLLEKTILIVVHATRKLPHYFQAHTVVVLTQLSLKSVLRSADYTGRIAKWGTILGAFDIKYMPRTSVKGQVLADLVAEFAECPEEMDEENHNLGERSIGVVSVQCPMPWELYVDGAANQRGSRVGLVLVSPEKITIGKSLRLSFSTMNDKAKYEALLIGMMMVQKMRGKAVKVFSDSKLVVGQVKGDLETHDLRMQEYLCQIKSIQAKFEVFDLSYIPRGRNTHANSLATLVTSSVQDLPQVVLVEDLCTPTSLHKGMPRIHQIKLGPSWMDSISLFLEKDILPEEKFEAEKVRRKVPRFWLSEDRKLYKRYFSGPYLLCVHPEALESLLEELHKGVCGSHTGGRSLSHRALTQGY